MYSYLLLFHSIFRWLVLASLLYAIYRAWRGARNRGPFLKSDNAVRHWTATISHIQLTIGCILYFNSPVISYFQREKFNADFDAIFFALIHAVLMFVSVVIITMGSALSKRKEEDADKYKTMLIWFTIALLIILVAIPWPFSPLAARPYWRS